MRNRLEKDLLEQAEAGDPEAQSAVGRFYALQGSDAESSQAAATWFRRAAEQGLAAAKHNLGVLSLRTGHEEVARGWFEAAARDGWQPSMLALGTMCEEAGEIQKAIDMYETAGARGMPMHKTLSVDSHSPSKLRKASKRPDTGLSSRPSRGTQVPRHALVRFMTKGSALSASLHVQHLTG